ncbi:ribosome maturation factor RimM [Actinotignum urinale]|uniref:Ribosome maturation factor RimM n=1 Tax=Actinotignum urinale TaxID=190146 RepID=A0AAW9HXD2_9ACTO|nr:ribosome maturation factor RimM [Actinotignum urinale]MDY5129190.1 ribosome maturation factor RimM [Actinotignum urinale]MDY5151484.1 ribosome maturation factor RimM [Actinotignum urinale]MDY5155007.1 ribosome maturation factor RimM [Actinotignum urinale]MDY5160738.1 ribosome maturation factor RimM [Actinotignum urinale]WIK59254.1 ribosome maturation factor RimM [Actinotignum urinale]
MKLVVAVVGAAQGLKGEVRVNVRTDSPEERFARGSRLLTDSQDYPNLTVERMRTYKTHTYLQFEEIKDRTGAENLRGTELLIDTEKVEVEEDAWYAHELVGLEVLDPEGYQLGIIAGLEYGEAQDLIVVREGDGRITRVPFVKEIVTDVDIADHCIVVDAPGGLFSDDEIELDEDTDKKEPGMSVNEEGGTCEVVTEKEHSVSDNVYVDEESDK